MDTTTLVDNTLSTETNQVAIYLLRDPRDGRVRYVGKAVDPVRRLRQHLAPFKLQARTRKNSWLKGLLASSQRPLLEIIDRVESELADEAERFHIFMHREFGADLTNGTEGGEGGAVTDLDARERIARAHRGSTASGETRAKMSVSQKARWSPAQRARRRELSAGVKPPVQRGEDNCKAKLTEEQVREIRVLHQDGATPSGIAMTFGLSRQSVWNIVTFKTWKHVPLDKE